MVGLTAFVGLFALLAWRPLAYPGVFEVAIVSKAALAVLGLTLLASADHGSEYAAFDGLLTSCSSRRTSSPTTGEPGAWLADELAKAG
jgi:hypothetical protein